MSNEKPQTFVVTVTHDPQTGDILIPLTDEVLKAAGLSVDDEIDIVFDDDCSLVIRRSATPSTQPTT